MVNQSLNRLSTRLSTIATRDTEARPSSRQTNRWPTGEEIAIEAGVNLYPAATCMENAADFAVGSVSGVSSRATARPAPAPRRSRAEALRKSISQSLKKVRRRVSGLFRRQSEGSEDEWSEVDAGVAETPRCLVMDAMVPDAPPGFEDVDWSSMGLFAEVDWAPLERVRRRSSVGSPRDG